MEYSQPQEKAPRRLLRKGLVKILIILISVLLTFEAIWADLWMYFAFFHLGTWEYEIEDFEEYRADFEAVKDECLNYINTHSQSEELTFEYDMDGKEYNLFVNGDTLIDSKSGKEHLEHVAKAFPNKHAHFSRIVYRNGCLFFRCTTVYDYQMVYTPDGEFADALKNVDDHSTRKAGKHWYHMAKTKIDTSNFPPPLIVRIYLSPQ